MSFVNTCSMLARSTFTRSLHVSASRCAVGQASTSSSSTNNVSNSGSSSSSSSFRDGVRGRGPLGQSSRRTNTGEKRTDPGRALGDLFRQGRTVEARPSGAGTASSTRASAVGRNTITTPGAQPRSLPSLPSVQGGRSNPLSRGKRFFKGRTYTPRDLNVENLYAERTRRVRPLLGPSRAEAEQIDPLFKLGLRPGHVSLHDDSYKNPVLLSAYVTEMGKIMQRRDTKLTRRSQREVAKAIRRARSMGLMPVMSRFRGNW